MKALVIFFEKDGTVIPASLELVSAAGLIADEITAVYAGEDGTCGNAADYCSRVIYAAVKHDADPRTLTSVFAKIAKAEKADYILLPGTAAGKELTGGIAAKLDGAGFNQVTDIECRDKECRDKEIVFTRPVFSGMIYEHIGIRRNQVVFSTKPGSFPVPEMEKNRGKIEVFELSGEEQTGKSEKMKTVIEIAQQANLEEADIVVAGGRGVGDEDGFRLVEELASALGGMIGATRMAIDNGWIDRTHQVGQSGKNVAPKLYIACGISGAVQHTCGISEQSFLVAVNKDEEAPIFQIADVGIVGDVKKVLPEMIREAERWKLEKA